DIINGKPGFTVALEFRESKRLVNVMVSDPGDLKKMNGSELTKAHWDRISKSRILGLVNWASMDYGTEVTEKLFSFAKEKKIKTFFDPADVLEKEKDLPEFKKKVLDKGLIDYFSMNDNEARIISRSILGHKLPLDYTVPELKKTISLIAEYSHGNVDVHTHKVSMSCAGSEVTVDRCHEVTQKTVTGAGDVWDAADLLGYLTGLEPEERLFLANGAAGLYVSRESGMPPISSEIQDFLKIIVKTKVTGVRS
ncbi:MAG: carbohydrate kinase family protein, partial [Thaumarchaeota archaeon]|nr:carbohydrate kinase family protein [Nitrososphaerota archaeon]